MMNYDIFISSHLAKLAHKACFRVGNLDAAHSEGVVSEGVSERVRDRQTTRQKKKTRRYRPPLSLSIYLSLSLNFVRSIVAAPSWGWCSRRD